MNQDASAADHVTRLYVRHHAWLLGRLRRKLPCLQDAEDITADTFVQVIQHPQPHAIVEPEAFLATIARRLVSRLWRRRHLEQAYLARLQQLPDEFGSSPEQQMAAMQALHDIDGWMRQLPIRVRMAFLYRVLDDMSHEEIASKLGVSVRTIGRYLQQATLQCLKAELSGERT